MKKVLVSILTICLTAINSQAQDLTTTNNSNSISCETTKEYAHFTFKNENAIRNTLLPTNQIITQQKNDYSAAASPANYGVRESYPRFRFAADIGWQYRTPKAAPNLAPELKNHLNKMRPGFHYDAQIGFFFKEFMGVEAIFSQQRFGNTSEKITLIDAYGYHIGSGTMSERMLFNYYGANYMIRLFDSKKKNCWLFSVGFGYMSIDDRFIFNNIDNIRQKGGTLGSNISIGYDIGLSSGLALGFKASLMGGTIRNVTRIVNGITTYYDLPEGTAEGLGTIKLSVGLRFNK